MVVLSLWRSLKVAAVVFCWPNRIQEWNKKSLLKSWIAYNPLRLSFALSSSRKKASIYLVNEKVCNFIRKELLLWSILFIRYLLTKRYGPRIKVSIIYCWYTLLTTLNIFKIIKIWYTIDSFLFQILNNSLNNKWNFSYKGFISLSIQLR